MSSVIGIKITSKLISNGTSDCFELDAAHQKQQSCLPSLFSLTFGCLMQILRIEMLQPSGTDGGGHVTDNAAGAIGHSSQCLV